MYYDKCKYDPNSGISVGARGDLFTFKTEDDPITQANAGKRHSVGHYLWQLVGHLPHPGEREDRAVAFGVDRPLEVQVHVACPVTCSGAKTEGARVHVRLPLSIQASINIWVQKRLHLDISRLILIRIFGVKSPE